MGGIGAALGIIDKVMSRFNWDRKSLRRNKIAKLEKKYNQLSSMDWTESIARKRQSLRLQLDRLRQEAIND